MADCVMRYFRTSSASQSLGSLRSIAWLWKCARAFSRYDRGSSRASILNCGGKFSTSNSSPILIYFSSALRLQTSHCIDCTGVSGVYGIIIICRGNFNSLLYARMATIDITCLPAVLSNIIAEFANPAGIAKCQCIRELQALHIAWEVNLEGEFHFCEDVRSRRNIDSHFLKRCIEKGWHQWYLFTLVSSMNSTSILSKRR